MRILAITDSYPPYHHGGYEIRSKTVLDRLRNRGHDTWIITTRPPNGNSNSITQKDVVRVLYRARSSRGVVRGILQEYLDVTHLHNSIRLFKPDIIYLGHILDLSRAIFPYLAEVGIPVVIDDGGKTVSWAFTHRGPWYGLIGHKRNSILKNWIKYLLRESVSRISRHRLKTAWSWPDNVSAFFNNPIGLECAQAKNVPLQDTRIIRSGVDIEQFALVNRNLRGRAIEILTPGRIEPNKGTIDAILLLEHVRCRSVEAKLTIVGYPYFPSYYDALMERINTLGLQQFVTVEPQVDYHKMPALYQRADFCFFPSYQKVGLSRVPLEAMASGCLVITYGNEGSSAVICHEDTGYIVSEGGIESAAEIICGLVAVPAAWNAIIHHARQAIEQHHSMDRYVDEIEAFLLKQGKGSAVYSDRVPLD